MDNKILKCLDKFNINENVKDKNMEYDLIKNFDSI